MTRVVAPFRGEFGIKLYWHVPAVHAARPDVVYCEEGDEALYPSAEIHVPVSRNDDGRRRNQYRRDADFVAWAAEDAMERFGPDVEVLYPDTRWPRERFVPEPVVRYGIDCDIVVAPRRRVYGSTRNWDAWPGIVDRLIAEGLEVFAVGAEESCYPVNCPAAWDYPRWGDAAIEAMHSAALVVSTDSGNAHLAVLCGRPLLLVTYRGLVGPGPVVDETGRAMEPAYGPVQMHRYEEENHMQSPIWLKDGWENPETVVQAALEKFAGIDR